LKFDLLFINEKFLQGGPGGAVFSKSAPPGRRRQKMKKYAAILIFVIFIGLLVFSKGIKNYSNSFFGVYAKKASVMGKVDGSAFEVWIYPYKVLHDLEFQVLVDEAEENPYERLGNFHFSHTCFEREFIGEKWTISERLYPAYKEPVVFLVYRVQALTDITLEFFFKPDLSPMWPAAVGGKYSYFDQDENFFVLSESTSKNFAFFGGFPGKKVGDLPAHKLPGGKLRYRVTLKKGFHEIPLAAAAAYGKYEEIKKTFHEMKDKYHNFLKEREEIIEAFVKEHLRVETPEPWINEAIQWGILNVHTAFVDNPDLGEGLIAGYGLSGERERPGFGWYFGGDGLINSFAVLNYGDFAGARKEIEFLLKYQRKDGKIMHELSQGAKFIDWFGDYGFPFFHGDTTLYFASFLDFYLQRTGDTNFFTKNNKTFDLIFSWVLNCDADKDGIVETKLAGVGASETGPLRQKMKTDIYLAALSVKAWEAMEHIYTILKDKNKANIAKERLLCSQKTLEKYFWDKDIQYYAYAVKEDGSPIKETTIWPAIAMRFKVLAEEKGRLAQRKVASPELSADWGTRFLSSQSGYYDPSSYNNGAVWPFLTGFSSLALYNYGNPYHGFSLLRANLNIIMDYDYGAAAELLSGDIYRPLDQGVPNQIWSSGNTISAFVEGLLGFEADALKKEIRFKPAVPLIWPYLKVNNLKVGKGFIDFNFKREKNRLEYVFDLNNLKEYTLILEPYIPALQKTMTAAGVQVSSPAVFNIAKDAEQLVIAVDISGYVYPYVPKEMGYGNFSKEPIIENFQLQDDSFTIDLWGKGNAMIHFYTDGKIECLGGEVQREGGITTLVIEFNKRWERRTITGKIY
jgi:glycogen debranching enzyme